MSNLVVPLVAKGGGGGGGNGQTTPVIARRLITTNTTLNADDFYIEVVGLGTPPSLDITLPILSLAADKADRKIIRDGTGAVSVEQPIKIIPGGSHTINGSTDPLIISKPNGSIYIVSSGLDWKVIGENDYNTEIILHFDFDSDDTGIKTLYTFPTKFGGSPNTMILKWDIANRLPLVTAGVDTFVTMFYNHNLIRNGIPKSAFQDSPLNIDNESYYFTDNGLVQTKVDYKPIGTMGQVNCRFSINNAEIPPQRFTLEIDGLGGTSGFHEGTMLKLKVRNTGMKFNAS